MVSKWFNAKFIQICSEKLIYILDCPRLNAFRQVFIYYYFIFIIIA